METHYLIEYENDGKNGLKGCENLSNTDYILLFYTDNSKNTTLDIFTNHGKAELDIKKVPVGDQPLDKHLIAYLGFLVGKNANKKTEYVIISSDKGYDKVGEFIREEGGKSISVSRRCTIAVPKDAQRSEERRVGKQTLSTSEIQYRPCVMNEVAKVVTSLYGNENL